MTEWRALTQGGCLSGSQTFYDGGSFTVPSGVSVLQMAETEYFGVTPGKTYYVDWESYMLGRRWFFSGQNVITGSSSLTISWSNSINQQTPTRSSY